MNSLPPPAVKPFSATEAGLFRYLDHTGETQPKSFLHLFSNKCKGATQNNALEELEKINSTKRAFIPLFDEACPRFTASIKAGMAEVFSHGTHDQKETLRQHLTKSSQNEELTETIRTEYRQILETVNESNVDQKWSDGGKGSDVVVQVIKAPTEPTATATTVATTPTCSEATTSTTTIPDAQSTAKSTNVNEEKDSSADYGTTLTLLDATGQRVTGKIALSMGAHNIVLQHDGYRGCKKGDTTQIKLHRPLYFFNHVRFKGMPNPAHSIVMSKEDFKTIKETFHSGAFGGDYAETQSGLITVWKHPADFLYIEGYKPAPVPVDVGTYGFVNDTNGECGSSPIRASATKLRTDLKIGTSIVSVHQFVGTTQSGEFNLPGISTGNFFRDFNNPQRNEVEKITLMVKKLRKLGIDAFSSNGSHHAVILHKYKNEILTPQLFAKLLQNEPGILKAISTAALEDKNMDLWKKTFIDVFG